MAPQDPPLGDWRAFVLAHGWRAAGHDLAAVLGVPQEAVEALRRTGACTRREQAHDFPALFALWHGRPRPPTKTGPRRARRGRAATSGKRQRSCCSPAWSAGSVRARSPGH